ncbi:hypothetical protein DL98DRAFT_569994 [Cadophora sp. DSE1049]|nr:hypothetical protein DL98DRAFT_569994 [Cadophora sp. DSE1049]
MPSVAPDPSFITPQKQRPPGAAASSMLTPPSQSTHTCSTSLFCCDRLYPLTRPLGPHEQAIYHFAYYMVNITNAPSTRAYLPAAHSILLEQSNFVIRFERWMNGEKDEIRHFMPHPKLNTTYIELKSSTLAASSIKEKWIPNWRYLKFRCDIHEGPWFTCFVLERVEGGKRPEAQAVRRKRKLEMGMVIKGGMKEDFSSDDDEPPDTPTRKITKRRRV